MKYLNKYSHEQQELQIADCNYKLQYKSIHILQQHHHSGDALVMHSEPATSLDSICSAYFDIIPV